jgi:hypothetical protein
MAGVSTNSPNSWSDVRAGARSSAVWSRPWSAASSGQGAPKRRPAAPPLESVERTRTAAHVTAVPGIGQVDDAAGARPRPIAPLHTTPVTLPPASRASARSSPIPTAHPARPVTAARSAIAVRPASASPTAPGSVPRMVSARSDFATRPTASAPPRRRWTVPPATMARAAAEPARTCRPMLPTAGPAVMLARRRPTPARSPSARAARAAWTA